MLAQSFENGHGEGHIFVHRSECACMNECVCTKGKAMYTHVGTGAAATK
jgi:hypothetical protein